MPPVGYKPLVLKALPGTSKEIAAKIEEACGMVLNRQTINRILLKMHQSGEIHIAGWRRAIKGDPLASYAIGQKYDARCRFKPKTSAEYSRESRARQRKSGEWAIKLAIKRTQRIETALCGGTV